MRCLQVMCRLHRVRQDVEIRACARPEETRHCLRMRARVPRTVAETRLRVAGRWPTITVAACISRSRTYDSERPVLRSSAHAYHVTSPIDGPDTVPACRGTQRSQCNSGRQGPRRHEHWDRPSPRLPAALRLTLVTPGMTRARRSGKSGVRVRCGRCCWGVACRQPWRCESSIRS
jgi:hypothetical protein